MASNGVTRPPALDVTMQEILDALKAVSFRPQVIDNLTSQDTGAPLSANQGRVLKSAIDGLVTQSITDGDTAHAPSGDAVHDAINAIIKTTSLDLTSNNTGYCTYRFDTPIRILSVFLKGRNGSNVNGWMVSFSMNNESYMYQQYYFPIYDNTGANFGSQDVTLEITYQDIV